MNDSTAAQALYLPARSVPVPQTISPEAQAFLRRGLSVAPPDLHHSDVAGWKSYLGQLEPLLLNVAKGRASAFPAEILEHRLTDAVLYEVLPTTLAPDHADKALLHIHGGAFIIGGGISAAYTAQTFASLTGLRSFSVDYRMPPDNPYPAGLDDCLEAYRFILGRFESFKIGIEGSSAGANLAAATILRARDEGLPLPGACALHTPVMDLTGEGDTFRTNEGVDVVLSTHQPGTMRLYAGGHDITHPYLSPVFGDFKKGFAPTILVSGTRDLLLSPTVMMHRALRRAGVAADLHVFEAMPHGGLGGTSPEDRELQAEIAGFLKSRLGV